MTNEPPDHECTQVDEVFHGKIFPYIVLADCGLQRQGITSKTWTNTYLRRMQDGTRYELMSGCELQITLPLSRRGIRFDVSTAWASDSEPVALRVVHSIPEGNGPAVIHCELLDAKIKIPPLLEDFLASYGFAVEPTHDHPMVPPYRELATALEFERLFKTAILVILERVSKKLADLKRNPFVFTEPRYYADGRGGTREVCDKGGIKAVGGSNEVTVTFMALPSQQRMRVEAIAGNTPLFIGSSTVSDFREWLRDDFENVLSTWLAMPRHYLKSIG